MSACRIIWNFRRSSNKIHQTGSKGVSKTDNVKPGLLIIIVGTPSEPGNDEGGIASSIFHLIPA